MDYVLYKHPFFNIGICEACLEDQIQVSFYGINSLSETDRANFHWELDVDGTELFCRCCGEGGEILLCDGFFPILAGQKGIHGNGKCMRALCASCMDEWSTSETQREEFLCPDCEVRSRSESTLITNIQRRQYSAFIGVHMLFSNERVCDIAATYRVDPNALIKRNESTHPKVSKSTVLKRGSLVLLPRPHEHSNEREDAERKERRRKFEKELLKFLRKIARSAQEEMMMKCKPSMVRLPIKKARVTRILCEDISNGREHPFKIPLVLDSDVEYEGHPPEIPSFTYIKNNIFGPSLSKLPNLIGKIGGCIGCDGSRCNNKGMTNLRSLYANRRDFWNWMVCSERENFSRNLPGPLNLESLEESIGIQPLCSWGAYMIRSHNKFFLKNTADVIFECNLLCKCDAQKCPNRILQRGITCRLEVFWTGRERGWGVRAAEDIPRGAMVCEYVGEYINEDEADKRANDLYLMELPCPRERWSWRVWMYPEDQMVEDESMPEKRNMLYKEMIEKRYRRGAMDGHVQEPAAAPALSLNPIPAHAHAHAHAHAPAPAPAPAPLATTSAAASATTSAASPPASPPASPLVDYDGASEHGEATELVEILVPEENTPAGESGTEADHGLSDDETSIIILDQESTCTKNPEADTHRKALHEAPAPGSADSAGPPAAEEAKMNPDDVDTIIDACLYGNVARFINHSCDGGNLTKQVVAVDSTLDLRWCRVALFAHHPIPAGTELTYDYEWKVKDPEKPSLLCHCHSPECRRFIL